jgi:very-short-patch-repair endonuclease
VIKNKSFYEIQKELPVDQTTLSRYASLHGVRDMIATSIKSRMEWEFEEFCKEYNLNYIRGNRSIISPKELDFYFPDIKLAIEFNGLYWHSEKFKKNDYHSLKLLDCKKAGISLLQFWEDEWADKSQIIKSKILHRHGRHSEIVGARKMTIVILDDYEKESIFLENNHIQGPSKNRSMTFGSYLGDELVGVMTFKIREKECELMRFATVPGRNYPGLFRKMLSYFVRTTGFAGTMSSFSDNNHSDGVLYERSGFVKDSEISAGYYVTDGLTRWRRERFMKRNIKKNYPEIYDPSLTESQMIEKLNFFRVWDSGKIKWKMEI